MTATAIPSVTDTVKALESRAASAEAKLDAIRMLLEKHWNGGATPSRLTTLKTAPKATPKAPRKPQAAPKAVGPGANRGRGRPPRFDAAQSLELAQKHAEGASINQLAQETNATRQAVKHAIERAAMAATSNGVSA